MLLSHGTPAWMNPDMSFPFHLHVTDGDTDKNHEENKSDKEPVSC
jgi:hypothetical protein